MKPPVVRNLVLLSIALLSLSACTSRKNQARIKELEAQIEASAEEAAATEMAREKDQAEKSEAAYKAQSEASQQIQQLTQERDQAARELAVLKLQASRAEAARLAKLPKDASTPGHPEFDPAKEAKITTALATIVGDKSTGTGFVVATEGKVFLYTAAHVIAGNGRLSISNSVGLKFTKFGNLEVAEGANFVRLELLDAAGAPALQLADADTKVTAETNVTGLGTDGNSGTVTSERGNPSGQSDESISVDSLSLMGKSGGPLLESATGKVLAVITNPAAEQRVLWADPTTTGQIPYRACRVNRKVQWKSVPIGTFLAEARKIAEFNRMTRVAQALAVLTPSATGLGVSSTVSGSHTALSVLTAAAKDIPIATEVLAMNTQLSAKRVRTSEVDIKKRLANLLSSAVTQMQRGAADFEPSKFTPYHRPFAEDALKWRKDAEQRLQGSVTSDE
ncbi:MAG: serine protease [Verrucomicrobia bacterium]|nr:serine protease [Verrucomicrobiota bacterium]